jgi:hypothetical protein
MLQMSVGYDGRRPFRSEQPAFDLPALTLSTQLQRYAMHRTCAGGGRATNDASRRRYGGQNKLILGTSRAAQSEPTELQDSLQMCEPHLDLFALAS